MSGRRSCTRDGGPSMARDGEMLRVEEERDSTRRVLAASLTAPGEHPARALSRRGPPPDRSPHPQAMVLPAGLHAGSPATWADKPVRSDLRALLDHRAGSGRCHREPVEAPRRGHGNPAWPGPDGGVTQVRSGRSGVPLPRAGRFDPPARPRPRRRHSVAGDARGLVVTRHDADDMCTGRDLPEASHARPGLPLRGWPDRRHDPQPASPGAEGEKNEQDRTVLYRSASCAHPDDRGGDAGVAGIGGPQPRDFRTGQGTARGRPSADTARTTGGGGAPAPSGWRATKRL